MPSRSPRLLLTTVSLAVVAACDPQVEREPAATARAVGLVAAPLIDCLTDTKLLLHHDDGTMDVTQDLAVGLAELARPRDLIEMSFAVAPECAAQHGRVTLAAYTSPGNFIGLEPEHPPTAFDVHTTRLVGDTQLLRVRLPDCYYELDLAFGEPLAVKNSPDHKNNYAAQSRLILAGQGGDTTCDEAPLAVERFDPVEAGWGDAPLSVHFGWQLAADPGVKLRCELDLDADGQADEILEPCNHGTELIKTAALPQWSYGVGKHRPELVVSDGQRRIWAGTDVYSNHLEYRPDVRFVEQLPGFLGADITVKPYPDSSEVVLHYKDAALLPDVQPGEVVVGHAGRGYMLRVEAVTPDDQSLVLMGHPVDFEDVIAGGFFGIRDLQLDTSEVACLEDGCADELVPVADPPAPPGGPVRTPARLALDKGVEQDGADPLGIKWVFKFGDNGEIQIFGGVAVDRFELDFGLLSVDHANISITPTLKGIIIVKTGIKEEIKFKDFTVGYLPTAIPLKVIVRPSIVASAAYKFTGTVTAAMTATAFKDHNGWQTDFTGTADGFLDLFGAAIGPELKATLVPKVLVTPGFIDGPYIAPTLGFGLRHTFGGSCDSCTESFGEFGAEFGWDMFGEKLFEPFKAIVARWTQWEVCEPTEPFCEEEPGGPVIVNPRDGQLLDCSHYPRLVFRAPGAATTEDPASPYQFDIEFKWENDETGEHSSRVNTSVRHGAPEWFIDCVPVGDGDWGECSFSPADNPCLFGGPKNSNHSWSVTAHVPPASGSATAEAEFAVP